VSHALAAWLLWVVRAKVDADIRDMLHVLLVDREALEHSGRTASPSAEDKSVLAIQEWNSFVVILTAGQKYLPGDHLNLAIVFLDVQRTELVSSTEDGFRDSQELIKYH
jgi:hypothetical protein